MREALLVRLVLEVDGADVIEHRRLVRQRGERTHRTDSHLRLGDQALVGHLQVALGRDARAERPCRLDLGAPLAREPGRVVGVRPGSGHDALRHGQERESGVAAVSDEVDEPRLRKEPLEHPKVLHVEGRLVTPSGFAVRGRVRLEDRCDGRPRGHPRRQPRSHVLG